MLKMPDETEDPPSTSDRTKSPQSQNGQAQVGLVSWIKALAKTRPDTNLRETLEEYIEEQESSKSDSISAHERDLLSNILKLRDIPVAEVMVPRADIIAIDVATPQNELLKLISQNPVSRLPVYKDNLDHVLGTIHIKDILAMLAKNKKIHLKDLVTEIPIVAPSLPISDLLLAMRENRRHMALVVDEYGGIDGLITIGDVIESIVGEIEDEHDADEMPQIQEEPDGSLTADARLDIDDFQAHCGINLTEEEREESDTLGGLVSFMAGRVPTRGEILTHDTGLVFEILDADPRRVNRLRIRNIPNAAE